MKRHNDRKKDQIRSVTITPSIIEHAASSVLFELGKTKVLCAVTLQNGVPPFLRGAGTGWLNAEYAMLPAATPTRNQRESTAGKPSGRTIEISRFISRTLRTIVDLSIGERTITIDCDVIQADGGTRTASICAAYAALLLAQERWLACGEVAKPFLTGAVAAVSVGVIDNELLLDLDYQEDSAAHADFNFVITKNDEIIEIQGGAEKQAISWDQFDEMRQLARMGITALFAAIERGTTLPSSTIHKSKIVAKESKSLPKQKIPFFSLQSRLATE